MIPLLAGATGNQTGAPVLMTGSTSLFASGTLNGGTVSVQVAAEASSGWIEVHSFSDVGVAVLDLIGRYRLRAVFSGSGADVSVAAGGTG